MNPEFKPDPGIVSRIFSLGCTNEDVAHVFGVSYSTISALRNKEPYASAIRAGEANAKLSLRRMMYKRAMRGNARMLIWLDRTLLKARPE